MRRGAGGAGVAGGLHRLHLPLHWSRSQLAPSCLPPTDPQEAQSPSRPGLGHLPTSLSSETLLQESSSTHKCGVPACTKSTQQGKGSEKGRTHQTRGSSSDCIAGSWSTKRNFPKGRVRERCLQLSLHVGDYGRGGSAPTSLLVQRRGRGLTCWRITMVPCQAFLSLLRLLGFCRGETRPCPGGGLRSTGGELGSSRAQPLLALENPPRPQSILSDRGPAVSGSLPTAARLLRGPLSSQQMDPETGAGGAHAHTAESGQFRTWSWSLASC